MRLQQTAGNRAVSALLARTPGDDDPGFSRDPKEAQKIGSAGEREEIGRVRRELYRKGYGVVYDRHDISVMKRNIAAGKANPLPRVDEWLVDAFPDGRSRPELVAIDHKRTRILVLDLTASPSTSAAAKPGDVQKQPADAAAGERGTHHLEKTIAYGHQAARKRPPWLSRYSVIAQDRYWTTGKYSVEVPIPAAAAAPPTTAQPGSTPTPSGWDPTAGPPKPGQKGPKYKPAPMDKPPKPPAPAAGKTPPGPAKPPPTPAKAPPTPAGVTPQSVPGARIKGVSGRVAAGGWALLAAFFAAWARHRWNEKRMKAAWDKLEPTILDAVDKLGPQAEALVERMQRHQKVYVNIYMNHVEHQSAVSMGEIDDWQNRDFHELKFLRAEVSTNDLKKELPTSTFEQLGNSIYWHNHFVYSVAVYDPEVELWEAAAEYERTHGGPPPMGPMWPRPKEDRNADDAFEWDRVKGRWVQKKRKTGATP